MARFMKSLVYAIVASLCLAVAPDVSAVVYVDASASGGGDGASWATAFNTIDAALLVPSPGEIWIAQGTYTPGAGGSGDTFTLVPNVTLYGGFTNGMPTLSDRDWNSYKTILDGQGTVNHIVTGANPATLDGLHVINGLTADTADVSGSGAGLWVGNNVQWKMSVLNCTFENNSAYWRGGAIWQDAGASSSESFMTISNCIFTGNSTRENADDSWGGAVFYYGDSTIEIYDTTFVSNWTSTGSSEQGNGGAVFVQGNFKIDGCVFNANIAGERAGAFYSTEISSSPSDSSFLINSSFFDNHAIKAGFGGAMWISKPVINATELIISNCSFFANSTPNDGGALYTSDFGGDIVDCIFSGNEAGDFAGTAYLGNNIGSIRRSIFCGSWADNDYGTLVVASANSSLTLINCLIVGNMADDRTGALALLDSVRLDMTNCTIAYNSSATYSTMWLSSGTVGDTTAIRNCIIYSNTCAGAADQILQDGGTVTMDYSCIEGGLSDPLNVTGTIADDGGNITAAPDFANGVSGTWSGNAVYTVGDGKTVLTNTGAFPPGALVGDFLDPNTSMSNRFYYISANDTNTITVLGDASIGASGSGYRTHSFELQTNSPCIDTGTNAAAPATDIQGNVRPQGDGTDMGAYENDPATGDVTPPAPVTGLSATAGQASVQLDWTNSSDLDFAGVLVLRRAGAAPSGVPVDSSNYVAGAAISNGTVAYAGPGSSATPGAASTWTDTNLNDEVTYHYAVFAYDMWPNYASAITASGTTEADTTGPADVASLTATPDSGLLVLSWTNPADADFAGVLIVGKIGSTPSGETPVDTNSYSVDDVIGDGTVLYVGSASNGTPGAVSGWVHSGITNGTHYYYDVYTYDEIPNYSAGMQIDAIPAVPGVIYVDVDAGGTDSGTTWADAYTNLQSALAAAVPGSTIWVAEGTYYPTEDADTTISFAIPAGISIYGGFASESYSYVDQDPTVHLTVLSGDIDKDSLLNSANSDHVITGPGGSQIDGFTITMGYTPDVDARPDGAGGGLVFTNVTSGVIANCRFIDNSAYRYGGAVSIDYPDAGTSGVTITNCMFERNGTRRSGAASFGGAIYVYQDRPLIVIDSVFSGNGPMGATDSQGGAICADNAGLFLDGCTFARNTAQQLGGAVRITSLTPPRSNDIAIVSSDFFANSTLGGNAGALYIDRQHASTSDMISNCNFFANSSGKHAGAAYIHRFSGPISGCVFSDNNAVDYGGSLYLSQHLGTMRNSVINGGVAGWAGALYSTWARTSAMFENMLVVGNRGATRGGAMHLDTGTNSFVNCTIADNIQGPSVSAGDGGAAALIYTADITFTNCIIYGNEAAADGAQIHMRSLAGKVDVQYSDLQDGGNGINDYAGGASINYAGTSISNNPAFIRAGSGTWSAGGAYTNATGKTILLDTSVSRGINALVGKFMRPDTEDGDLLYYIVSNDAQTVTVLGDASSATAGGSYEIRDYRIGADSPCLDIGSASAPATDLIGLPRPAGSGVDMGAYENPASGDMTLPDPVSGLTATGGQAMVQLDWTNPTNTDFRGVLILRKTDTAPTDTPDSTNTYVCGDTIADGTVVHVSPGSDPSPGAASSWIDINVEDETSYNYVVFAYDWTPNYAVGIAAVAATEPDTTAPADVLGLSLTANDGEVVFSWANPLTPDFKGVLIVRKVSSYPFGSPSDGTAYSADDAMGDGTVAYMGTAGSGMAGNQSGWLDGNLTNDVDYYYTVYTYDEVHNYSSGVQDTDTPTLTDVIYVDGSVSGGADDGSSWVNAYTNLHDALSAAQSGSHVWIAEGTYYPSAADRSSSFQIRDGIELFGGLSNGTASIYGQAPDLHPTILSGDIDKDSLLDDDNSYSVMTAVGATNFIVDGLTITMGYSDTNTIAPAGGGAAINFGETSAAIGTIADCKFTYNSGYIRGGALYAKYAAAGSEGMTITNCVFEHSVLRYDSSLTKGGAIWISGNRPVSVHDSVFTDNEAESAGSEIYSGGALYLEQVDPVITGCTFGRNSCEFKGGAIYAQQDSATAYPLIISDCSFYLNISEAGGAVYVDRSSNDTGDSIRNCNFYANEADTEHGGALLARDFDGTIDACIFSGNKVTSAKYGAAIDLDRGNSKVNNSIFCGGTAFGGGGIYVHDSVANTHMTNLLIVGNSVAARGGAIYAQSIGTSEWVNCTIANNSQAPQTDGNSGGGALHLIGKSTGQQFDIRNCIIYGNSASATGPQIRIRDLPATVNIEHTDLEGGTNAIYDSHGTATIADLGINLDEDPIYFGGTNGYSSLAAQYDSSKGTTVLTDIGGIWETDSLVGNFLRPDMSKNLQFYIVANGMTTITVLGDASTSYAAPYRVYNYHLAELSGLLDTGTSSGAPLYDLDGDDRPLEAGYDMGVYEGPAYPPVPSGMTIFFR